MIVILVSGLILVTIVVISVKIHDKKELDSFNEISKDIDINDEVEDECVK